jgi:hypothetical protein
VTIEPKAPKKGKKPRGGKKLKKAKIFGIEGTGPYEPVEEQANHWMLVYKAILQRQAKSTKADSYLVTMMSASQGKSLYKDVESRFLSFPVYGTQTRLVLEELDWLKTLLWSFTSARAGKAEWSKPAGGQRTVGLFCPGSGTGQAVRAALCSLSLQEGTDLRSRFEGLMAGVAAGDERAVTVWREDVAAVIRRSLRRLAGVAAGSAVARQRHLGRLNWQLSRATKQGSEIDESVK